MDKVRVPIFLQQAVMRRLRSDLALANKKLASSYSEPSISYCQRGTIAGMAHFLQWRINLNPVLLLENQQAFIDEVVPHELAHLLVYRQYGDVPPHGREWQYMMSSILNVTPQRTHNFALQSVMGKSWLYQCQCQQHYLTSRRHNRIIRGESEYQCKYCGQRLSLVAEVESKKTVYN